MHIYFLYGIIYIGVIFLRMIPNKTNTMKRIEQIYGNGDSLEELLRKMYVEREMTIKEIADELNCSSGTIYKWLKMADITTRKMKWE